MKRQRDLPAGELVDPTSSQPHASAPAFEPCLAAVDMDSVCNRAPDNKDAAGDPELLQTVDDVLTVLPHAQAAEPCDPPAYEERLFHSPQQRVLSDPPSLDLSPATGMLDSPALMPATAHAMMTSEVEQLPSLTVICSSDNFFPLGQKTSDSFFPFGQGPKLESASTQLNRSPRPEPSEGGILMLSDIQEAQAARSALHSAWRDYGSQLKPAAPLPCSSSASSFDDPPADGRPSGGEPLRAAVGAEALGATAQARAVAGQGLPRATAKPAGGKGGGGRSCSDDEMADVLDAASVRTILLGDTPLGDCSLEELLHDGLTRGRKGGKGGKCPRVAGTTPSEYGSFDSPGLQGLLIEGLVQECGDALLVSPFAPRAPRALAAVPPLLRHGSPGLRLGRPPAAGRDGAARRACRRRRR
eukprot:CAMPEP_0205902078 /NCGR_PEP_ID=MMETSP1083-20121108/28028_1 /ASSEMBLY_ACC=CAM_ASM_000430 /TAXON_ID=97485 /ORGANISM="Prymnesium parvum, Strain Texoma1" /LENGTH=413 /DNA_ID=CAMNT_0053267659 /DNA_START=1 /DNA_END=1240 /DNA_ORIENTATION=+